ncbi:hypothetical protein BUE93_20770 [Chromobacterium amazonense]|uniref:Phage tail protein n=1 Tax=Chromobacterium amazonense TaxID=1382803 RepID=A0A2S9WZ10_9NEIS|nr:hypothetical protein [Chromobacterium amazonense]PRP68701.1 hypothetical protein BUE93_20770 [Chromobacterium amazonense]
MAFGANTTGDTTFIDVDTPYGPLRFKVASFHPKPKYDSISVTPLNSEHEEWIAPRGWEGDLEIIRTDATADNFFAQWEADFYAGSPSMTQPTTITETIKETDGSTSTFKYTGVALKLTDPGKRENGKPITMQISFTAKRRLKS